MSQINFTESKINQLADTNKKIKIAELQSNENRKSHYYGVNSYANQYPESNTAKLVNENKEQMKKIMESKLTALKENEKDKLKSNVSYYENLINVIKKNKHLLNELNYEGDFNEDYKEVQKINSSINEKEKIIHINNQSYKKKNEIVHLLVLGLIGSIIFAGFSILYFMKVVNGRIYMYLVFALLAIAILLIVFHIFRNTNDQKFKYEANKAFNDMLRKSIRDVLPSDMIKKCPTNCKKKEGTDDTPVIYDKAGNEIITDSGQNPWKDGDISVLVGSPDNLDNPIFNNSYTPESRYGPDPNPTIHNMKWQGNPDGRLAFDGAVNMGSEIPAEFWPGYSSSNE